MSAIEAPVIGHRETTLETERSAVIVEGVVMIFEHVRLTPKPFANCRPGYNAEGVRYLQPSVGSVADNPGDPHQKISQTL